MGEGFVQKIHHSGITVKNTEESVAFYEKVFGFRKIGGVEIEVDEEGDMKGVRIKITFLKAGDADLELLEYLEPKGAKPLDQNPWNPGSQHVSLRVTKVREFFAKYRDSVQFLTQPVDYKSDEIDTTWTYLKDPNGTILELSEDHMERVFKSV
jgi:catechol 2,3-dioxygenase-like lactoylglutathione lyase family enzyme